MTDEIVREFKEVPYKCLIFTHKDYPDLDYTFYLPEYKDEVCAEGFIADRVGRTCIRKVEFKFDFVKWFNSGLEA